ncbi:MAG TPA: adenylate/guanylate cyclase domain-containing protein [Pyrinomonadaceae bacterium]|jgi:adenylate cyclase
MSYRTRLLITFLLFILVINGLSLAVMYELARRTTYNALRAKALSVAATTATLVDGDLHRKLQTRADEDSEAYRRLEATLRQARDANRRDDTYIKWVYTLMPARENPNVLVYGVDAEENFADKSHVGDVYRRIAGAQLKYGERYAEPELHEDAWGTWLSAYAPVKDSNGQIVCVVGVDMSSQRVALLLRPLLTGLLLSLLVGALLGVVFAGGHATHVSRPLVALRRAVESIGRGELDVRVEVKRDDEFGAVGRAVNLMAEGLREREVVKTAFARYVSGQVLETVLSSGQMPAVAGTRRRVTVLFSDIRGFTGIAENLRPESVVELLNEYFESMVDIVFRYHGTLDKFIGDGLMVIFGAPVDDPSQEEHAVQAAIEMQRAVRRLSHKWQLAGRAEVRIGIGINSGHAIVGNIGSNRRLEFTAIGDTVNLASRLESATKELATDILISENTYDAVRGAFAAHRNGEIHVKGRTEPVVTYSVEYAQESAADADVPEAELALA